MVLDSNKIPIHIAIIMDGNGRWAAKRILPKKAGHKAGAQTLEKISTAALNIGVKHLTVYAFSTENWKRSKEEVDGIMDLLRSYLTEHVERASRDNVKVDIIGDISPLDLDLQQKIAHLEEITKHKTGMSLHIALNYGARDEILRCFKKIESKIKNGELDNENITEDTISQNLDTKDIPDPELVIRTSGEKRISNFLLWQIAYSEFIFIDKLWPDFNKNDFITAIYQYQNRERRFGGR